MRLARMAGDDSCKNGTCPTVFTIEERNDGGGGAGSTVTDAETLAQLNLAPGKTAVRVPLELLRNAATRLAGRS